MIMVNPASAHTIDEGMVSNRGRVRPRNEDSYGSFRTVLKDPAAAQDAALLQRKGRLYIVADGMGGHDLGDLASATAVQQICAAYYADQENDLTASLQRAIVQANSVIYAEARTRRVRAARPMGTTVVCAVLQGDRLILAHLG